MVSSSVAESSLFSLVFVRLCRGLGFVRKGKEKGREVGMLLEAGALQILLSHFERGVPVSFSVLQKHSFHSCLIRAVGQNLN
jgi:hypothetical protein